MSTGCVPDHFNIEKWIPDPKKPQERHVTTLCLNILIPSHLEYVANSAAFLPDPYNFSKNCKKIPQFTQF
jgi:hypothetical protein